MAHDGVKTCSKCGRRWDIYKVSIPMRDKDSIECDCGETLIEWNGGVMFRAEPVGEK
ncbi:hypothetical protein [Bacillus sp. Hm123]|uniref:hypothetical protein n=1 Tax=Bacillus sp. Hm123 TaxID=3450745 RepID=UPI003F4358C6